jgi:hypothetical protein
MEDEAEGEAQEEDEGLAARVVREMRARAEAVTAP